MKGLRAMRTSWIGITTLTGGSRSLTKATKAERNMVGLQTSEVM